MIRKTSERVANTLLSIGAIGVSTENLITFKSGIKSPVYIDNRILPFHPEHWRVVIVAMQELLDTQQDAFDVIAGIETAGIPHSAALSYTMRRPSVFVRKAIKDHGRSQRIEGGSVVGKRVLLIEDQVTTGGSSLAGVAALRENGAIVEDCLTITSYGFREALDAFTDAGVRLHTLTHFSVILEVAEQMNYFERSQIEMIRDWLGDPRGWSERH
ncbi:MAG: orotate phosphoribosyltransferase [Anaerolineae bacterium]|jgi:orotate phosphoribosyltransferase|nr:orotate phosphoribosyltransferase [Anaerolineae bacterium]